MNALFRVELLTNHSSVFMCVRKVLVGESLKRQAIQLRKYNKTKQKKPQKNKKKKKQKQCIEAGNYKIQCRNAHIYTYYINICTYIVVHIYKLTNLHR